MQLGQLLDTDMVPPAVMRHHVQVGGKSYALGTLIYFVPDVRVLTRLGPQVPTFTSSLFHTHDSTMNLTICLRIDKIINLLLFTTSVCYVDSFNLFSLFSVIVFVFEIITK